MALGDGSGGFTGSPLLPAGIGPYDVKIDDYNADGIPDLSLSTNGGYLVLLTGLGDGTFGARLNFGLVGLPLAFVKGTSMVSVSPTSWCSRRTAPI